MILLRSLLFNLYFFGVTFVLSIVGTIVRLIAPRRVLFVPQFWARAALAGLRVICGIRLEVIGRERLPISGAALIAPRHQSAFDTLVWLTLLPRCCYVIKERAEADTAVRRDDGACGHDPGRSEARRLGHAPSHAGGGSGRPREPPDRNLPGRHARRARSAAGAATWNSGSCRANRASRHSGSNRFRPALGTACLSEVPGTIHIAVLPAIAASAERNSFMRHLEQALQTPLRSPCGQVCKSSARALRSEVQATKASRLMFMISFS